MRNDEVLNKHFLPEISEWYFKTLTGHDQADEQYADDLIRSLIKVIFYWFIYKDRREIFSLLLNGAKDEAAGGAFSFADDKISISSLNELFVILNSYKFTLAENTSDALGPELLGAVFEKLLANYHTTSQHTRPKITARSRTGSFYTPQIIVSYMVHESLKSYLHLEDTGNSFGCDKRNELIDSVDRIKILDPACGSGAFLIGMIDEMTDLLRKADPDNKLWKEKQIKRACAERDGVKRKKIICEIENIFNADPPDLARRYFLIKNSIFGVDIQNTAVDIAVCRLIISLYALGRYSKELSPLNLIQMARGKFACADTLVDFDPERIFGIKSGFDIVIGNPPYIEFKKLSADEKEKLARYKSAKGKYDIYVTFIERSLELLHENGTFCCILPTTFMKKQFGQEIRKMISSSFRIINIQDFADIQVFGAATSYTGVFLFRKESVRGSYSFQYHQYQNTDRKIQISDFRKSLNENKPGVLKEIIAVSKEELSSGIWNFQGEKTRELLRKIYSGSKPLSEYSEAIFQGISSGKDEVFYIDEETICNYNIEKGILKKLLKGRDIKSYRISWSGSYVIYPYDEHSKVFPEKFFMKEYPNAYRYLQQKRKLLEGRNYFDESNKKWYELWNHRNYNNFMKARIVTPEISSKNNFALTDSYFGNTKTYHILPKDKIISTVVLNEFRYFLLGLLNSKLIDFIYKKITTPYAHGFYAYKTQFLNNIPIKINENLHLIAETARIIEHKANNEMHLASLTNRLDCLIYKLYLPEETEKIF